MRVVLDIFQPSLHWVALARVIENNPDLPGDVTLIVQKDRMLFRTPSGDVIPILPQPVADSETLVHDVKGKLRILAWVHECYPAQPVEAF